MPEGSLNESEPHLATSLAEMTRRLHWSITHGIDSSDGTDSPFRERRGQVRTMHVLARGDSMTMNDLAERLEVSRPTVTGLIRGLVEQGFVTRTGDPDDWRVVRVEVTPAGREALHKHHQDVLDRVAGWLSELEADELDQLRAAIPAFRAMSRILDSRRVETGAAVARNS